MAEHIDTIADLGRQYFSHDDSFKQSLTAICAGRLPDDPP